MKNNTPLIVIRTIAVLGTVFFGITVFVWTLIPFFQYKQFYRLIQEAQDSGSTDALRAATSVYEPFTYVQPQIRYLTLGYVFDNYKSDTPQKVTGLLPFGIEKLEEAEARQPDYTFIELSLAKAYSLMAQANPDHPEYITKTYEHYQKALALIPGSPDISYAYAVDLLGNKEFSQAIPILEKVVASDPRVPKSHYYLGLAYFQSSVSMYDKSLGEFEIALNAGDDEQADVTRKIYNVLLQHYYATKDMPHFSMVLHRLIALDTAQSTQYAALESYIEAHHSFPIINFDRNGS